MAKVKVSMDLATAVEYLRSKGYSILKHITDTGPRYAVTTPAGHRLNNCDEYGTVNGKRIALRAEWVKDGGVGNWLEEA
jgi:hypothetical protein